MSELQKRLKAIDTHKPYIESDKFREEIKIRQRVKGAEKYNELFDPSSHTDDELADHAMMEFHDGQEYVAGMRTRMRELREEIMHYYKLTETQKTRIRELKKEVDTLKAYFKGIPNE